METNKIEARKAMDNAEKKLAKNDYAGAKKLVNKAQNLYPKLDGLKQVLMMIDVYISASKNGKGEESDWYGILGVDPLANEETLKKQYKKLALLIHPDKNKFHGAEEAFKLVLEAWSLLSDKAKRKAYDQKRKSKQVKPKKKKKNKTWKKQKPPPKSSHHEEPNYYYAEEDVDPRSYDYWQYRKAKEEEDMRSYGKWDWNPKEEEEEPRSYDPKSDQYVDTFWTFCNRCNTYCEKERAHCLNETMPCPNCGLDFVATEIFPEMVDGKPVFSRFATPFRRQKKQSTRKYTSNTFFYF